MPRLALVLGVLSLACSVSVVAFFVGVPLGLLAVVTAFGAIRAFEPGSRPRRIANRALVVGGLGLTSGLLVWFVHVRAIQVAYSLPTRNEMTAGFEHAVATASAPLPGAAPRLSAQPAPATKDPR